MTDRLDEVARDFNAARDEAAELRKRLTAVQATLADLRPKVTAAIVDAVRNGTKTQIEISRATGYTAERIRQICREAGIPPPESPRAAGVRRPSAE
ncbi:hypothetical protein [Dactylosporangium maewongense]